jgi:hypothetical protein
MCLEPTYRTPRAVTGRILPSTVGGTGVQVQNVNGGGDWLGAMSAPGIVSRVTPVHTAARNCTRDEGRPFEVGNQVLISSHRKLLSSKAMVVKVAEKSERDFDRHD